MELPKICLLPARTMSRAVRTSAAMGRIKSGIISMISIPVQAYDEIAIFSNTWLIR